VKVENRFQAENKSSKSTPTQINESRSNLTIQQVKSRQADDKESSAED
jgi:hypothetical protein